MSSMKNSKKSPSKAKSSKKSSKKTKAKSLSKKFPPLTPPRTQLDPENLFIWEEKDGSKGVLVRPNFAGVACIYHPARMKEVLAGLIFRFIELKRSGQEPDIAMFTAGTGTKIGRVAVRYEDDALQEVLAKYSQMGADYFTEHLVRTLADLSELLIMQVFISTLAAMKTDGVLAFKEGSGVTKMWDSFNEAMAKKVKRDWKAPKQGRLRFWNEKKRAEALEIYNSVKETLGPVYPNRRSKEGRKEWLRLIMELGDYDRETAEYMQNNKPSILALTITGKRLGVTEEDSQGNIKGESSLNSQLSLARGKKKDAKRRKKCRVSPTTRTIY
jgi:hypothetical protein